MAHIMPFYVLLTKDKLKANKMASGFDLYNDWLSIYAMNINNDRL